MIELTKPQAKLVVASLGVADPEEVNEHLQLLDNVDRDVGEQEVYGLYEEIRTKLEDTE